MSSHVLRLVALLPLAVASVIEPRQDANNTAVVDLTINRGPPVHYASGAIYGVPNTPGQIPAHFFENMGYNYGRSGGGQLTQGGWIMGLQAYEARFASAKENYEIARSFGGDFVLLPHDLWGTDHANASTAWPGDNGDWTDYDNFLDTVFHDIKSNNMVDGLVFDTWNEPDGGYFWKRNETQYLELWDRTYRRIRSDSGLRDMGITGPSSATQPSTTNAWWMAWAERIVQSNSVPDWYSWHDEPGDPDVDVPNLKEVLAAVKAPSRPININEYATYDQQVPAGSAWFMARLERWNAHGLRGNWLSGCQLYDFIASLLTKQNTTDCSGEGYQMNGDYTTYQYYNLEMTGHRTQTTGSKDGALDAYATVSHDKVRILTGILGSKVGTWYLQISGLSSAGLKKNGYVDIQTWAFEDTGHFGASRGPSDRGVARHSYSGNSITLPIFSTAADVNTSFAFEFNV